MSFILFGILTIVSSQFQCYFLNSTTDFNCSSCASIFKESEVIDPLGNSFYMCSPNDICFSCPIYLYNLSYCQNLMLSQNQASCTCSIVNYTSKVKALNSFGAWQDTIFSNCTPNITSLPYPEATYNPYPWGFADPYFGSKRFIKGYDSSPGPNSVKLLETEKSVILYSKEPFYCSYRNGRSFEQINCTKYCIILSKSFTDLLCTNNIEVIEPSVKRDAIGLYINVYFESPILTVYTSLEEGGTLLNVVSVGDFTTAFMCDPVQPYPCNWEVPYEQLLKDGILYVQVYQGDIYQGDDTFMITSLDVCTKPGSCVFCAEIFTNYVCYSSLTQRLLIAGFALSVIGVLICIFLLTWKIYCCIVKSYPINSVTYVMNDDRNIEMGNKSPTQSPLVVMCLLMYVGKYDDESKGNFLDERDDINVVPRITIRSDGSQKIEPYITSEPCFHDMESFLLAHQCDCEYQNVVYLAESCPPAPIDRFTGYFDSQCVVLNPEFKKMIVRTTVPPYDEKKDNACVKHKSTKDAQGLRCAEARMRSNDFKTMRDSRNLSQNKPKKNINSASDSTDRFPISFPVLIIILLMFMVVPSLGQCTDLGILDSPLTTCTTSGSVRNCQLSINIEATLLTLGSKVCGLIQTTDGILLGSVNITYSKSNTIGFLQYLYSTSSWNLNVFEHKHCAGASICPTSGGCRAIPYNSTNLIPAGFSASNFLYPNYGFCTDSCGCAGCGCINCASACQYAEYEFVSSGQIYSVAIPTGTQTMPTVDVSLELGGVVTPFTVTVGQSPVVVGNYTFLILGTLAGGTTLFSGKKVVYDNVNNSWITPAADYNNPAYNAPGDIQGATIASFTNPNPTSFIFPNIPLSYTTSQSSLTFAVPAPGISVLSNPSVACKTPCVIGSSSWAFNGINLVSLDTNPPPVVFSMQTNGDVAISFDVTSVCPIIAPTPVPIMSGCYNCLAGFTIMFTAKSGCDSGSAIVSMKTLNKVSLYTPSVLLTGINSVFILTMSSLDINVDITITISGVSSNSSFRVHGPLSAPPTLTQQQINQIVGNATDTPTLTSLSEWWNSLSGLGLDAMKYTVSVVLVIVVVAIIVGFIVALVYFGKHIHAYRQLSSSDDMEGDTIMSRSSALFK